MPLSRAPSVQCFHPALSESLEPLSFSRASWSQSFYSAPSVFEIEEETFVSTPSYQLDFQSFAAYWGLHLFVRDNCESLPEDQDVYLMTCLLGCTIDEPEVALAAGWFEIVILLLEKGADPNLEMYNDKGNPWTVVLRRMEDEQRVSRGLQCGLRAAWGSISQSFIVNGADMEAMKYHQQVKPFSFSARPILSS